MSDPQHPPRPDFTKPTGGQPQGGQPEHGQPQYGQPQQDPYGQYGQPSPQGQPLPPYAGGPGPYGVRPLSPQDERTWGMLAHLSSIAASFVALPFLGPLIVFLVLKDRSRFVRGHAAEALNMNLSYVIYSIALSIVFGFITLVTLGLGVVTFYLLPLLYVPALVFAILGAVAAYGGRPYRYPLIFRFVH